MRALVTIVALGLLLGGCATMAGPVSTPKMAVQNKAVKAVKLPPPGNPLPAVKPKKKKHWWSKKTS